MRATALGLVIGFVTFVCPVWARAQTSCSMHVGGWSQNTTREICAHQAIAAMAKEKFIHAEIDTEGNAWGCSDKTVVVVLSFRQPDGINVINFAAGRNSEDAGRLRNSIRTLMQDTPYDPKGPKQIGARGSLPPDMLHPKWHVKNRNIISVLRFFEPGVCILLEKQGLNSNICGKGLVMGGKQDHAAAIFLVPGPNAVSVNVGVLAISPSAETSQRSVRALCADVVKLLYE